MSISFPNLGIGPFDIQNYFEVFGFKIYWYGVIIAIAFALAIILATGASKKFGIDSETIIDLALWAVPISVVTARLYYVVFDLKSFNSFIDVINLRKGGLAIYGGIIGAVLTTYIFARIKKINILSLLDFGVPYLVLGQAIGRWGNFTNQEAYGTHTDLPWGMSGSNIADGPVHPTFLYESLWNLCLFIFLIWFRNRKKINGEVFFLYMSLYGAGRFWIESLRTDSLMLGDFRISQVLAFLFALVFIIIFLVMRMKAAQNGTLDAEVTESKYGALLKTLKDEEENTAVEKNEVEKSPDADTAEQKTEENENK